MDEIIGKLCYLLVYFVGNVFSCASAGLSKVAWLRVKIAAYLISIGQLLCLLHFFDFNAMAAKLCKKQQISFGNNTKYSDFIDGKYILLTSA